MTTKYQIKDGKLCDATGRPVRLITGDAEQIAFLREHERKIQEEKEKGILVDVHFNVVYTADTMFKCSCGFNVYQEMEADGEGDLYFLEGVVKICNRCKKKYKLSVHENDQVRAKSIS